MIRAIIVDVDDTLCLTEEACYHLENRVLADLGLPYMPREIHVQTWGQPLLEAIALRSPGIDIALFASRFATVFRKAFDDGLVDVIPEPNLQTLDWLKAQGHQVIVLTSRTLDEVGHLLGSGHALGARLDAAFHASNTQYRKPNPRAFDELLAWADLDPDECLYVGDSPGDAIAAKGAGLTFVASMESGLRTRREFEDIGIDGFIDRFIELAPFVAKLANGNR